MLDLYRAQAVEARHHVGDEGGQIVADRLFRSIGYHGMSLGVWRKHKETVQSVVWSKGHEKAEKIYVWMTHLYIYVM